VVTSSPELLISAADQPLLAVSNKQLSQVFEQGLPRRIGSAVPPTA